MAEPTLTPEAEAEAEADTHENPERESPLTPQGEIYPDEPEWMRSEPPAPKPPPAKVEPPPPAPSIQQPGGEEPATAEPEPEVAAPGWMVAVVQAWRQTAKLLRLPGSERLAITAKRKRSMASRPASWRTEAIDALAKLRGGCSGFLIGQNDRGWVANFDWFLKPDTVAEILEGKWDPREAVDPKGSIQVAQKIGRVFDEYKAREQQRETQEHERRLEITDGNE
jgi:hypothetical protein